MLRILGRVTSINVRKVLWTADEIGLGYEREDWGLPIRDPAVPEFLALNPNAMVPVLVDGDLTLWESNAINQYLVQKAGGSDLFPADPKVRADIARWQFWEQAHFNRAFGTLVFESVIKPRFGLPGASQGLVDFCLQELARFAPVLDTHLQGRATLVGKGITLADYAMICLEKYRDATAFDWSPYANINRYFDEMRQADAWMRAAPPTSAATVQAAA